MSLYHLIRSLALITIVYNIFDSLGIYTFNYIRNTNELAINISKYSTTVLVTLIETTIIYLFFVLSNNRKWIELNVDSLKKFQVVLLGIFLSVIILKNLPDLSIFVVSKLGLIRDVTPNLQHYLKLIIFLTLAVFSIRTATGYILISDEKQNK